MNECPETVMVPDAIFRQRTEQVQISRRVGKAALDPSAADRKKANTNDWDRDAAKARIVGKVRSREEVR